MHNSLCKVPFYRDLPLQRVTLPLQRGLYKGRVIWSQAPRVSGWAFLRGYYCVHSTLAVKSVSFGDGSPLTPLYCVRECVCPIVSLFSPFSTYILVLFSLFMIYPCLSRLYILCDLCYGFLFSFIITVLAPPSLPFCLCFLVI